MELVLDNLKEKSIFHESFRFPKDGCKEGVSSNDKTVRAVSLEKKWSYDFESNLAREQLNEKNIWRKRDREVFTIISPFEKEYKKAGERIEELSQDLTYANAPNETAKRLALHTLELLKENALLPALINSSHDESIVFEFFVKNDAYSFDFYNDGDTLYGRRVEGKIPHVAEIKDEERLIEAILEISHAYGNL